MCNSSLPKEMRKKRGQKKMLEEIMAENVTNLVKNINLHIKKSLMNQK